MQSKLAVLAVCIMAMVILAGCGSAGSSGLSLFGSSSVEDNLVGGDLAAGGGNNPASGGTVVGAGTHMPEPATVALLGSGLLAYALLRRKRRR